MSRKPEAVFRMAVERHLPDEVYRQSMGSMYANGTPDRYYEGPAGVLWAEYKYLPKLGPILDLRKLLTALQSRWLERAYSNGVPVCVIVGWGAKQGVLFGSGGWDQYYAREKLERWAQSRADLALAIAKYTVGSPDET